MTKNLFVPPWSESAPPQGSYRSILKWGEPNVFKHPNRRLYEHLKPALGLQDEDFRLRLNTGEQPVEVGIPSRLSASDLQSLCEIVGPGNVQVDDYARASHAYGKSMLDILRLRCGWIENPPDAVVHPRDEADVKKLVDFCNRQKIPIVPFGGGTSVTQGIECTRGGISLDMRTHLNRVIEIDDRNQTVRVQPGILGPDLEKTLNQADKNLGKPHPYTCGHFPQSFEYSTVGGWVLTRGAGQNSTYYGKIEDLVLSQKYVTPAGEIRTIDVPAKATGPDLDQIMIGSEGAFGILVQVTLKIFRFQPENRRYFSFMFRDWESALAACRETMQGEFGFPSVFRCSDPEETDVALKIYGVEGTLIDRILQAKGYRNQERCLLLGHTDGDADYSRLVSRKIHAVCRQYGALSTTGYVAKRWERGRFSDPYLREDLGDFGIVIDTLECGVNWSNLEKVWSAVHECCHARPSTICMSHASHFYPQGANLYFIYITRVEDIEGYRSYQSGILDTIQRSGATMSHHHGIGKMLAPWLEGQIGENELAVFRSLKRHFDPQDLLNPGGTLNLDPPR